MLIRAICFSVLFATFDVHAVVTRETERAAAKLGAAVVGEVEFDKNDAEINEIGKHDLDDLIRDTGTSSDSIQEIRVIAWSDREYPKSKGLYTREDIELAKLRANKVKEYLAKNLKTKKIVTFNMADRPNALQSMFNTTGAKTKTTLEQNGAAPNTEKGTGLFAEKSKSRTAMILVFKKATKPIPVE
jgi:hypothetical protein